MHRWLLAAGLLLAALWIAGPAGAHERPDRVPLDESLDGDVYALSIAVDETVTVDERSRVRLAASYTGRAVAAGGTVLASGNPRVFAAPDVTFASDAPRQHGGAFAALLEGADPSLETARAFTAAEFDRMFAVTVESLTAAHATVREPVNLNVASDEDQAGLNGLEVRIEWSDPVELPGPPSSSSPAVYHLLVTVPGAERLDVAGHLHLSPASAVSTSTLVHEGGFLLTPEDFAYDQRVQTAAASAAREGQTTRTFDRPGGDERFYARMGPSNVGTLATSPTVLGGNTLAGATLPNAAAGDYNITLPDGETRQVAPCLGAGPFQVRCPQFSLAASLGPTVLGSTLEGTYAFNVQREAGVLAQDLYAVGFEGPVD